MKQHYEQKGSSPPNALIDDERRRQGREATAGDPTAALRASPTSIQKSRQNRYPELAGLIRRRALEQQSEEHKQLKGVMPDAEWQAQFEKLMLELAQVSAEIRKKS